jgi:hypothetical protein
MGMWSVLYAILALDWMAVEDAFPVKTQIATLVIQIQRDVTDAKRISSLTHQMPVSVHV